MERVQVAATAANTVSYIYDTGPTGAVVAAAPTQNGVSGIFEFHFISISTMATVGQY